ncbi:hypothetical protein V8C86DRAFT_3140025, partial [Haematococcus lacustris]
MLVPMLTAIRSRSEHMSDVAATVGCSQPALGPSSGHIAGSSITSQTSLSLSLLTHHKTGAIEAGAHHTVGVVLLDALSPPSAPTQAISQLRLAPPPLSPSIPLETLDSVVVPHYHHFGMPRIVENGMAPLTSRLVLSHLYVIMCCKWCSWCCVVGKASSHASKHLCY